MTPTQSEFAEAASARPWPAERIELWPIERLIRYENNARLHSEADLDKLAAAIRKWGWTNPVLVDEEGNLLAGHGRVAAAPRAGATSIPGSTSPAVMASVDGPSACGRRSEGIKLVNYEPLNHRGRGHFCSLPLCRANSV